MTNPSKLVEIADETVKRLEADLTALRAAHGPPAVDV
jgi:hypothetical protein